jgi:hypothetical protein
VPCAPWLVHSPRCGPGGKVWVQKCAQALLPPSCAKATPGMEANAPPTRAPPIHLSAWRRDMVPFASPFATSSKEVPTLRSGWESPPLLQLSLSIRPAPFPRHATLRSTRLYGSLEGVESSVYGPSDHFLWVRWPLPLWVKWPLMREEDDCPLGASIRQTMRETGWIATERGTRTLPRQAKNSPLYNIRRSWDLRMGLVAHFAPARA